MECAFKSTPQSRTVTKNWTISSLSISNHLYSCTYTLNTYIYIYLRTHMYIHFIYIYIYMVLIHSLCIDLSMKMAMGIPPKNQGVRSNIFTNHRARHIVAIYCWLNKALYLAFSATNVLEVGDMHVHACILHIRCVSIIQIIPIANHV